MLANFPIEILHLPHTNLHWQVKEKHDSAPVGLDSDLLMRCLNGPQYININHSNGESSNNFVHKSNRWQL